MWICPWYWILSNIKILQCYNVLFPWLQISDIEADNPKAPINLSGVWIMTEKKIRVHINFMNSVKLCVILFSTNRDYPILHSIFLLFWSTIGLNRKISSSSSDLLLQNLTIFIFKIAFRWKHVVLESDNMKFTLVRIRFTSVN